MEVSGKRAAPYERLEQMSSAEQYEPFCQPCLDDGKHHSAHGYCSECCEYLCKDCYRSHSRFKSTKRHVVLYMADMPHGGAPPSKACDVGDQLTNPCPVHADRIAEYHCETHVKTACSVCVTMEHRDCHLVKYIPDIAKGIIGSQECKDVQQALTDLTHRLNNIELQTVKSLGDLEKVSVAYKLAAKTYRDELVAIMEKLAAEADKKRQDYVDKIKDQLNNAREVSKDHLDNLESAKSDITERIQAGRENSLFVSLKQVETLISESRQSISNVENDLIVKPCEFEKNAKLHTLLSSIDAIGKLVTKRYPHLCHKINVKAPGEIDTCHITASHILKDGRLIVTDSNNASVKLFDTNHTLVSHPTLQLSPGDIARVNRKEVAVTLPDNKTIQLLCVSDKLIKGRAINTDVKCFRVAVCGDKLIVIGIGSKELMMLDMSGTKIKRWKHPNDYLHRVMIHPDNNRLYVSHDTGITCVNMDGKVVGKYRDDNLESPEGLAVHPDGSVYVCGRASNNIHHITSDCEKISVLLNQGEVIEPYTVCVGKAVNRLYVSECENDTLKVFKLMD